MQKHDVRVRFGSAESPEDLAGRTGLPGRPSPHVRVRYRARRAQSLPASIEKQAAALEVSVPAPFNAGIPGMVVNILMIEDDANDEDLTRHALQSGAANELVVARDGVEALDHLFGTGGFAGRDTRELPALLRLDLNLSCPR